MDAPRSIVLMIFFFSYMHSSHSKQISAPSPAPSLEQQLPPTPANVLYYNIMNTTEGSTFHSNVEQVLKIAMKNAPFSKSYVYYTQGQQQADQAYALAACIKTRTNSSCSDCLNSIKSQMEAVSPLAIGARKLLMSNDTCYLQYESGPILPNVTPTTTTGFAPDISPSPHEGEGYVTPTTGVAPSPRNVSPPATPAAPAPSSSTKNHATLVAVLLCFVIPREVYVWM